MPRLIEARPLPEYKLHLPPHFHTEYGEERMAVAIDTLAVIAGKLRPVPRR